MKKIQPTFKCITPTVKCSITFCIGFPIPGVIPAIQNYASRIEKDINIIIGDIEQTLLLNINSPAEFIDSSIVDDSLMLHFDIDFSSVLKSNKVIHDLEKIIHANTRFLWNTKLKRMKEVNTLLHEHIRFN